MPGAAQERPRAHRLTDIEPQTSKALGCNRMDEFRTAVGPGGNNMGSVARFPKLDECAHFHYEHVELGALEVSVSEGSSDSDTYTVRVTSGDACWSLQRSYDNFVMFDKQLHRCIFDRKFSSLAKLPDTRPKLHWQTIKEYVQRFSQLNHEGLNCGPVLNWLQLDNRGRRILVPESDSCPINTPAVAAAYAVRPYVAQAQDEISFQVGDMISVIDMPPPGESTWWRGKHGFAVGFFPAECVAVIGDKVPRHLTVSTTVRSKLPVKPVLRKHGKLIAFFRSFILNRPSRRRLKQSGILKERVFGCDLGEHLLNSGQDVPTVLTCCAEFIENHGLVDGIYRLSGVTSNIQRLRNAFDEDRVPALHSDESILQDIHSVASLLKMYFRELPNPLCTYQLYSTFVNAVQANTDAERIRRMRDTVRKLPPPHYRTLEYLMRHLVRVAARGAETGMTPRNVAIVWAPNLLRCKELEVGGVAALQGVGVQAVVTEFLVCYAELIFGDGPVGRPKSLAISTPARLLSLEEARNRNVRGDADYIDVGAGPAGLPLHYHTVIDLPRKRNGTKRSPSLNWRALFGRGALGARGKARQVGTPPQTETISSSLNSLRRLRPVKSADSLDGEDSLGPLLGPPAVRACGHSRSVSHDSYFDHLTDAPNATSPLDLSEIQLNFDLEEREMRMFSEEEGGGAASVEASPRRQRSESAQCPAATGGSKRKRSRLEERLHCDVELRFIDSQSPDQVMVSADVHNIDTPSPLATPGYLPLLSESSTPLSPATLEGTSPQVANSPRISFRSFTLPLEIDGEQSNANNSDRVSMSSDKTSEISDRLSLNLNERQSINANAAKQSEEILVYDRQKDARDLTMNSSESRNRKVMEKAEDAQDEEMTPCERLLSPSPSEPTAASKVSGEDKSLDDGEGTSKYIRKEQDTDRSTPEFQNEQTENEKQILDTADNEAPPLSTATDLDSPMSCEQALEDLPDSGFVICDNSEKIFTNTETQQQMLTTLTNDPSEWIIVERTSDSIVTPPSDGSCSPKDSLEGMTKPALMNELPCGRSETEENVSRTSLDFEGLSGTLETDTSCVGVSDLPDSPVHSRLSTDLIRAKDYKDLEDRSDDPTNNNGEIHSSDTHEQDNGNNTCCAGLDNDKCLENHRYMAQNTSQQRETQRSTRTYSRLSDYREKKGLKGIYELENANETSDNKCENFEESPKQEQQKQQSPSPRKYISNSETSGSPRRSSLRNLQMRRENVEAIILSENATQPREIAHTPEGAAELVVSFDSSCTFSNPPSPLDESVVLRDTAAILQELALQRLSGGMVAGESSISPKKRYDCDLPVRERRSFDSEIGREIVRERKMRQELDSARGGKSEESPSATLHQHLPPCLKARHSRAHRATLSRSLDEAKFNKITGESSLTVKQTSEESQQHSSTPNVGAGSNSSSSSSTGSVEKVQARNLGGLDLGNPQCRERIERYKEERRTFLRDKYRSESFRSSGSKSEEDGAEALVARLKQRASRPSLH